ncbi:MAG: NHL repeat-containing protein [Candidatus Zixiibacteriota bacterium]
MSRTIRLFVAVSLTTVLATCSRPPQIARQAAGAVKDQVPEALIVEQEIAGPMLSQSLRGPSSVVVDFRGAVYICDAGNNRIIKLDNKLKPIKDHGGFGAAPGLFSAPAYMSIDNSLNLWVSETGNRRLSRFDGELNFVDALEFTDDSDLLKFGTPAGVAATQYGTLWVADRDRSRVAVFNNVGTFEQFVGDFGSSGGPLSQPVKVVLFDRENYAVCDAGNGRVAIYDSYGNFLRKVADIALKTPVACAFVGADLWVLDRRGILACFSASGHKLFETGPLLTGNAVPLKSPSDIALLNDDRLLIVDTGNDRLLLCRIVYQQP